MPPVREDFLTVEVLGTSGSQQSPRDRQHHVGLGEGSQGACGSMCLQSRGCMHVFTCPEQKGGGRALQGCEIGMSPGGDSLCWGPGHLQHPEVGHRQKPPREHSAGWPPCEEPFCCIPLQLGSVSAFSPLFLLACPLTHVRQMFLSPSEPPCSCQIVSSSQASRWPTAVLPCR